MADFHVFQDLGDTQAGGGRYKDRRYEAKRHHHPATHFQGAVQADDLADVGGIPLAQVSQHFIADGIQVLLEAVQLFFAKLFHSAFSMRRSGRNAKILGYTSI